MKKYESCRVKYEIRKGFKKLKNFKSQTVSEGLVCKTKNTFI